MLVDVGGQGSPQQVYFGTEYRAGDAARFVVPIEVLGATFFVLIALVFVGVGQMMGRAFTAAPDRLLAYIVNIGGSLAGITAFAVVVVPEGAAASSGCRSSACSGCSCLGATAGWSTGADSCRRRAQRRPRRP